MYAWMREDGLSPDRATYSRLISVCAYSPARAREAEELYQRLLEERVELDAFMYLHLVTAIASGGLVAGAASWRPAGGGGRTPWGGKCRAPTSAALLRGMDAWLAGRPAAQSRRLKPAPAPTPWRPCRLGRRAAALGRCAACAARHADGDAKLQGHTRAGAPPACPASTRSTPHRPAFHSAAAAALEVHVRSAKAQRYRPWPC